MTARGCTRIFNTILERFEKASQGTHRKNSEGGRKAKLRGSGNGSERFENSKLISFGNLQMGKRGGAGQHDCNFGKNCEIKGSSDKVGLL